MSLSNESIIPPMKVWFVAISITGEMSEVSYEYGGRGGLVRYREDGTIESYQTWNNAGSNTPSATMPAEAPKKSGA